MLDILRYIKEKVKRIERKVLNKSNRVKDIE